MVKKRTLSERRTERLDSNQRKRGPRPHGMPSGSTAGQRNCESVNFGLAGVGMSIHATKQKALPPISSNHQTPQGVKPVFIDSYGTHSVQQLKGRNGPQF